MHVISKYQSPEKFLRIIGQSSPDHFLGRLVNLCGDLESIQAEINMEFGVDGQKMKIPVTSVPIRKCAASSLDAYQIAKDFSVPNVVQGTWDIADQFTAKLTIKIVLSDKALNTIHLGNVSDPLSINRGIMADAETSGDVVIEADNGERIKCHKVFLTSKLRYNFNCFDYKYNLMYNLMCMIYFIAQSAVFRRMFDVEMQENLTKTLKLPDMTEAGIKALLAYIYCRDITEILKSSSLAFDLLVAADKYEIDSLVTVIWDVIMLKDKAWFSAATAFRLIKFSTNKRENGGTSFEQAYKELETKAVKVVQS